MTIESKSVKVGSELALYHNLCHIGPRGLLYCENFFKGKAEVKSIIDPWHAGFQMNKPTTFSKGDYFLRE